MRTKTGRQNKAVLKILELFPRRYRACAQSLLDSQCFAPQARARWKEDMFRHNVELSDRQDFPRSSQNLDRKIALRRTKNTLLSNGTKNVENRRWELGQPCARSGTRNKKRRVGNPTCFSSLTTAFARRVFLTHNELIHEPRCVRKMSTPATSCNSRFAGGFPRLAGILPENRTKTTPTPQLPGEITLPSELRFAQTLYFWKVDIESFPTICCMTHFEYQKTPKTSLENQIRKGYAHKNREGFGGGAAWQIRSPRGEQYSLHGIITSCAASCRARRAARPIKQTLPPSFPTQFCSSPKAV
uniref:Uncharacterized protein n=1 Tax=Fagus sylvatica TaxID=28930 RepID=A0A2N9F9E8_FAGSY